MKKILSLIGISVILILTPILSAAPIKTNESHILTKTSTSKVDDYDGTFTGGLGRVYKENDEWQYEVHSYIAGVYKDKSYKILYGHIYNLEKEQINFILNVT